MREEDLSPDEVRGVAKNSFESFCQRPCYRLGSKVADQPFIVDFSSDFPWGYDEFLVNHYSHASEMGYGRDRADISTSNAAAGRFSPQDLMTRGFTSPMTPASVPSDIIAPHLPDRKLGCSLSLIWNDRPLFSASASKEERISVNPASAWIVTAASLHVSWIGWISFSPRPIQGPTSKIL